MNIVPSKTADKEPVFLVSPAGGRKTIAHWVEDKLFERSLRSSTIQKKRRLGTTASKIRKGDDEEDPMKNLKTSLMMSIVNQHEKLSARSASVDSQRKPILVQDIEENPQILLSATKPVDDDIRTSLVSGYGGKKKVEFGGVIHEVRSQGSSQEDFSSDSLQEEEEEPIDYMQTNFPNSDGEDAGLRIGPSETQRPFPMPEEEEEEFVLHQQLVEDQPEKEVEVVAPEQAQEQLSNMNKFFKTLQSKKQPVPKARPLQKSKTLQGPVADVVNRLTKKP